MEGVQQYLVEDIIGEKNVEDEYSDGGSDTLEENQLLTDEEEDDEFDTVMAPSGGSTRRPAKMTAPEVTEWVTAIPTGVYDKVAPLAIIVPQGKSAAARAADTPSKFLDLYVTPAMLHIIVSCTNEVQAVKCLIFEASKYEARYEGALEKMKEVQKDMV